MPSALDGTVAARPAMEVPSTDAKASALDLTRGEQRKTFQGLPRPAKMMNLPPAAWRLQLDNPLDARRTLSPCPAPGHGAAAAVTVSRVGSPPRWRPEGHGSASNSPRISNISSLRDGLNKSASTGGLRRTCPLAKRLACSEFSSSDTTLTRGERSSSKSSGNRGASPHQGFEGAARLLLMPKTGSSALPGVSRDKLLLSSASTTPNHFSENSTPSDRLEVQTVTIDGNTGFLESSRRRPSKSNYCQEHRPPRASPPQTPAGGTRLTSSSRASSSSGPRQGVKARVSFSRPPLEGAPAPAEVLARLEVGVAASERAAFSEAELSRMRRVFALFRHPEMSEVDRETLHVIFEQLGYFSATEDSVEDIAAQVSDFSTFSYDEFVTTAEKMTASEVAAIDAAFACARLKGGEAGMTPDVTGGAGLADQGRISSGRADRSGQQLVARFQEVLHSNFDVLPVHGAVSEALVASRILSGSGVELQAGPNLDEFDVEQFRHFIACYSAAEGFAQLELQRLRKIYDTVATRAPRQTGGVEMPLARVHEALLQFFGLRCAGQASELVQQMCPLDSEGNTERRIGLSFREFLALARRLREVHFRELHAHFHAAAACRGADSLGSAGVDVRLTVEDLVGVMRKLGFNLLKATADEFCVEAARAKTSAAGSESDTPASPSLSFDEFVHFVHTCYEHDGFSASEREELSSVFATFDYDKSGTIENLELVDMLRYLGHTTSLEVAHRLIREVDVNKNGGLEFPEFLRLMRLHREMEVELARTLFTEQRQASQSKAGHPQSFDEFVSAQDELRRAQAAERRRRAGYSEAEFASLRELLSRHDLEGRGALNRGELMRLVMEELSIPMGTCEERNAIFGLLDTARNAAVTAGVEPSEACTDSALITIWCLAHLLRALAREKERAEVERELVAMEETNFSHAEVAEFREVFVQAISAASSTSSPEPRWAQQAASQGSSSTSDMTFGRRHSMPQLAHSSHSMPSNRTSAFPSDDAFAPCLSEIVGKAGYARRRRESAPALPGSFLRRGDEEKRMTTPQLRRLLRSAGLHLDHPELWAYVSELSEGSKGIDFAAFLHLMRWMLDSNFDEINGAAKSFAIEKIATPARRRRAAGEVRSLYTSSRPTSAKPVAAAGVSIEQHAASWATKRPASPPLPSSQASAAATRSRRGSV